MHLVTRGHLRSRDKDGGHTIQSAVPENPMLHARKRLGSMFNIAGIGILDSFGSCDLDLDPMTFIYELDP